MKNSVFFLTGLTLLLLSCGDDHDTAASVTSDSPPSSDSLKRQIAGNLPPSEDLKQFEWIYSSFVAAVAYSVKNTDVFINKETGLWVISSNGAMPQMVRVNTVQGILASDNDTLVPIAREKMICELKSEEIPKPDCDKTTMWSKDGCFTSEHNTFKDERLWDYAGLNENDEKAVEELAGKITRIVVNTQMNMRMYFMMKDGSWYLVFLDLREPCSA